VVGEELALGVIQRAQLEHKQDGTKLHMLGNLGSRVYIEKMQGSQDLLAYRLASHAIYELRL
jgi:hypothetical protein